MVCPLRKTLPDFDEAESLALKSRATAEPVLGLIKDQIRNERSAARQHLMGYA
jgi:hypothetical protein